MYYLCVSTEAEHDVVDEVLKHKVVVIVGRSQLNILDDELVQHDVHRDHGLLQLIEVAVVLLRDLTPQHLGPDTASQTVRTTSLEILLRQRRVIHVQHLHSQLIPDTIMMMMILVKMMMMILIIMMIQLLMILILQSCSAKMKFFVMLNVKEKFHFFRA